MQDSRPRDDGRAPVCERCGQSSPAQPPPLTWVASNERGQRAWCCERCARENLRSIEGKLDSAWW